MSSYFVQKDVTPIAETTIHNQPPRCHRVRIMARNLRFVKLKGTVPSNLGHVGFLWGTIIPGREPNPGGIQLGEN